MHSENNNTSLLEEVPHPDNVRERIAKHAEEGRLLRSLFKLAKKVWSQRQEAKAVQHAR